jgi:hypothetical protein
MSRVSSNKTCTPQDFTEPSNMDKSIARKASDVPNPPSMEDSLQLEELGELAL